MPLSFYLAISLAPGFFLNMWTTWATAQVLKCHAYKPAVMIPIGELQRPGTLKQINNFFFFFFYELPW